MESQSQQPSSDLPDLSQFINVEISKQLQEMGFSKIASDKACLYNQNNIERAVDWINEHQNDPDFEEPVQLVGAKNEPKSQLTPEEAKIKARELQERMRKIHQEKEKALKEEQEKNRVRQTKELLKAQEIAKEQEMKHYIEKREREKKEEEIARRQMLEQLARDKEERFGKKFDPYTQNAKKEYTKEENVLYYLKSVKALYPPFREPNKTKNCFGMIKVALNNILKNVNEEKFRKLKLSNPNVQERVGSIPLAMKALNSLGFVEEGEYLVCKEVDEDLFRKVIKFLEEEIAKL